MNLERTALHEDEHNMRKRVLRSSIQPLEVYVDISLDSWYCFWHDQFLTITDLQTHGIEHWNSSVPVCSGLRYLATGSLQNVVGNTILLWNCTCESVVLRNCKNGICSSCLQFALHADWLAKLLSFYCCSHFMRFVTIWALLCIY